MTNPSSHPFRNPRNARVGSRGGGDSREGAALTSPRARSWGGGPLSGPRSRVLRRHTPKLGLEQLDTTGSTIDTGRKLERSPYPHPHHVTSCQRGARKLSGRGERRTFRARNQPPMRRGAAESGFEGKGAGGDAQPRPLLLRSPSPPRPSLHPSPTPRLLPRPPRPSAAPGGSPPPPPPEGALDALSLSSSLDSGLRTPQCRICFQGPEQGELLSPCRCDGSVRCTHQPCLIRWISERGSWSCELCYFKYQVLAISTKNPLQWQAISLTVIEKVQIAAIVLGSLFLVASISWLIWSSLSPSAKWQRQDLLFQICYGMYGFMDVVCIGLIVHEGSSVYRIFKRWQAVNQQWKVLNYDKTKDIGGDAGGGTTGKPGPRTSRTGPPSGATSRPPAAQRMRTLLPQRCGYTILHLLGQLRPPDARSSSHSGREVVMRVTTV
ncbi:E3 ubiquitin-protein ligase MARCHF9 [Orycteropus afer afer]|uniref:RING-type E3 ubiquitin transferase n=1 Tax=Orycteropus afer afer TaxID=1230840 RepID=A0A8B7APY7_ORYAF|nr:E3 ubiquitin-protein ligase MARCHF9 [Orycteropus afer afer]